MKKYEKEYMLKKEQEAQLEDPVERLQVICQLTFLFVGVQMANTPLSGNKNFVTSNVLIIKFPIQDKRNIHLFSFYTTVGYVGKRLD